MKSVYSAVRTGTLNKAVCAQNVYAAAAEGNPQQQQHKKCTVIYFEELSVVVSSA
jgi:hypothetical protein